MTNPNLLLSCIVLLTQALLVSMGHYTGSGLFFTTTAALLLLGSAFRKKETSKRCDTSLGANIPFYLFLIGLFFSASIALNPRLIYAAPSTPALHLLRSLLWLSLTAGGTSLLFYLKKNESQATRLLIFAFLAAAATKFLVVSASPMPRIDVVTVGMEAMERLRSGINPYREAYPDIYAGRYGYAPRLTYPPGYLLLIFPVHLLFGDIRWASVFSEIAAIAVMICFLRQPLLRWLTAWVWAAFPLSLFIIEQGWVDHLMLPFAASVLLAFTHQRWRTAGILLGILSTIKQYAPAVAFFALIWTWKNHGPKATKKTALWAVLSSLLILLPWLAWDARALYASTVAYLEAVPPRPDALSWFAHFLKQGKTLSPLVVLAGAVVSLIGGVRLSLARPVGSWLVGAATLYLGLFLFAKQAFCNYYAWACSLLWLAVIDKLGADSAKEKSQPA